MLAALADIRQNPSRTQLLSTISYGRNAWLLSYPIQPIILSPSLSLALHLK